MEQRTRNRIPGVKNHTAIREVDCLPATWPYYAYRKLDLDRLSGSHFPVKGQSTSTPSLNWIPFPAAELGKLSAL
jgi:hypothetical protein